MSSRSLLRIFVAALVLGMAPGVFAQGPGRVASLVPAATEVLYAIGAGQRVVAVSDFDDYPDAVRDLPRIGGLVDPNFEVILALRPDLVIVDPTHANLRSQLHASGIETYSYGTEGLAELTGHMRALGRLLGVEAEAETAAARFEDRLRVAAAAAPGNPPRALVVFGRRPGSFAELWVSGGRGALHEIVATAGARNVFAELDLQSFKSGLEGVLARAPEVVIEFAVSRDSAGQEAIAEEWRSLPGFANVRVVVLTESWMLRPVPRTADLALWLAERLQASVR